LAVITMKELLEAGVHFGHQTRRWNPKMKTYIYHERNGIYIIDLHQTLRLMEDAYKFVRGQAAEGGEVLFVCTKRQGTESLEAAAQRCRMPYVNKRWLGGMLTNFNTMKQRIAHMNELDRQEAAGEWSVLSKKEALMLRRERDKLLLSLGGIRDMKKLPSVVYIVDLNREQIASLEAQKLGIPIVALLDTNCDPTGIDYVVPANDDAIRAIRLLTEKIADAVVEGQAAYQKSLADAAYEEAGPEAEEATMRLQETAAATEEKPAAPAAAPEAAPEDAFIEVMEDTVDMAPSAKASYADEDDEDEDADD